jgi:hypothetical protein
VSRAAVLFLAISILGGCGLIPTATPASAPVEAPGQLVLPGPDALLPAGVAGVPSWVPTDSRPDGFDPGAVRDTPEDVAEAYVAAAYASFAGPMRPVWKLEEVQRLADGRAVVIVTELGAGDDSVAGTQYAIVVRSEDGGWLLETIFARPLCRRGVADRLCV